MTKPRRPVPPQAMALTRSFEKLRLVCFDTDGSHTPTIAWGHTKGLKRSDVGVLTVTPEEAEALLVADYDAAACELEREIGPKAVDAMTDNQYAAMCDFMFNLGVMGPTLRTALRKRRFDQVPTLLAGYEYVHPYGPKGPAVKSLGLVRRRNAERELWATGEPGTVHADPPPSGALQVMPTPPAPTPPPLKPQVVVAATISPAIALVLSTPDALNSAAGLIQEVIDKTAGLDGVAHVHQIRGVLTAVAGFLVAVTPLAIWGAKLVSQLGARAPDNVAM